MSVPYSICEKDELDLGDLSGKDYDFFLSGYTRAERVTKVFASVSADKKLWLIQPEYGLDEPLVEDGQYLYTPASACDEVAFVRELWEVYKDDLKPSKRICIDITGLLRPNLMFLIRFLFEKNVKLFDVIYTEPVAYSKGDATDFSGKDISKVLAVSGFCGNHEINTSQDILIVGVGYDDHLIATVAEDKDHARKVQLFGFPALKADMFQENLLKAAKCEESMGQVAQGGGSTVFAPAYDPFMTAEALSEFMTELPLGSKCSNLYLSPLSSKPQVLGFVLYYLLECIGEPVSMIFPYSRTYNPETSQGISRIWRYSVELDLV